MLHVKIIDMIHDNDSVAKECMLSCCVRRAT